MNYEKKYNEALKRAKAAIDIAADKDLVIGVARTIFPELRESEDERIRKAIIEHFKQSETEFPGLTFGGYYYADVLAYLEKQKGQDWNKKPCLTCQEYEKGHKQGYTEGCTAGYNKAMKEVEQKEQNLTMANSPQLKEQKQEWSEEDKAIVNCIVCCLDGQFVPEAARKQSLEWFNKHRRDFLNRPSWKPSEEQMEALEYVIRDYREDGCNATANYLQEILDHLKNM